MGALFGCPSSKPNWKLLKQMVGEKGFEPPTPCHENWLFLRRLLLGRQRHNIAETFQTMNQVAREMILIEFVEVKISQVVVGNLLREHMVDRYQDLVGHGHGGPFVAAPGFEPIKLVPEVSPLGSGGGVGGFH